jgi:6,7-dimethyl-8-ribityllumazine synthase
VSVPVREIGPNHSAVGRRFCIVAARFNAEHVERMTRAAVDVLTKRGAAEADVEIHWVPGSFELPLAARWAAETSRFDAILALGVLIRGETEHFRLVADACAHGLLRVSLDTGVPVLDGVLAVNAAGQADARTGGALGNRGADVALAAIHMANLRDARGGA